MMILCTWCKCKKSRHQFYFRKDGRVQTGCKTCRAEYRKIAWQDPVKRKRHKRKIKEWTERHKEELTEYAKQYHIDHIKKAHKRNNKRSRERWANDSEYRKRKNKQKAESVKRRLISDTLFKIKHKFWADTHNHNRRLAMVGALKCKHPLKLSEWLAMLKKYNYRCLCCGKKKSLTFDHIRPITKKGKHTAKNIQPLCASCNAHKHTKIIDYRPK